MKKKIKSLVFASVIFISSSSYAQNSFELTFGGVDKDYGYDLLLTDDGGYLLSGLTYSFGTGNTDFYLIKTDDNGVLQWSNTYGGVGYDYPIRIISTSDGGYLLGGTTTSYGAGMNDGYVIKINSIGDTLWTKTYGGWYNEVIFDINETSDKGFVMVGKTLSFDNPSGEVYLIKTDSVGDTLFTKRYGAGALDWGFAVEQTGDGGYIICGKTESWSTGYHDAYLIRTTSTGDTLWTRTFGGALYDWGNELLITDDGGFIITGNYNSSDFDGLTGDVFLFKVSASGNMEWQKSYGGTGGDFANRLIITSDNGYFLVGATNSIGAGDFDLYVLKTDINGDTLWTKTFGGTGIDVGYSARQTPDGGYVMIGRTSSSGNGQDDVYLIKMDGSGTVGVIEINMNPKISAFVYPNPIVDKGNIIFSNYEFGNNYSLEIFDISGKKWQEVNNIQQNKICIEKANLTQGMYFFKIVESNSNEAVVGKFGVE